MTEYGYPADEFDEPPTSAPRSVHRAPRSWWSRWGAFVVVLVVVPLIAVVAVTWLSDWQPGPGSTLPAAEEPDEPGDETDAEEPGTEEPGTEEPTTTEPEPEPEPEPVVPEPDLTRAVVVLNATQVSGLAGRGAEALGDAGFTTTTTGNWQDEPRTTSVVFYPTPEDQGTAEAVAAALGIATVEPGDGSDDRVVAVVAQDFTP